MYNLINRKDKYQNIKERLIVIYYIAIEGHLYIGSSMDFCNRIRHHRHELMNNYHANNFLQNSYNKYNKAEFGILQEFDLISGYPELFKIESNWIKLLNADLNLADPEFVGTRFNVKAVYQYDLKGNFIKEWSSVLEASTSLNVTKHAIYACCSNGVAKSAHNYIWSYEKLNNIQYSNNTGCNLSKTSILIFENDLLLKQCDSISDGARFLKDYISFEKDWKLLRPAVFTALKNNWKIRGKFTVKYNTGS